MGNAPTFKNIEFVVLTPEVLSTLNDIDEQRRLVSSLTPGTADHRLATKVLLLHQDSLHAIAAAQAALSKLKR